MHGADLEPSARLLEHIRRRLVVLEHELAAADVDGRMWALGADLDALRGVLEVLVDREKP